MHKLPQGPAEPARLFHHGGAENRGQRPLLDFSVSLNPLGPPAAVLAALRRELAAVARYPDPACRVLTERLAAQHGVEAAQVVVGNGSSELIHAIPRAFQPRRVAIVEPTYTEYLRASLLAGAEASHWLAAGDSFELKPFDPEAADLVWLGNPNNPTGQLWPRGSLTPWVQAHPRTLFVVDEAFLPFLPDEAEHSFIPSLHRLPHVIVVRSLTKIYTLPGLRLGYAVTSPELAERLRAHLVPWSVNVLAQVACLAALEDEPFLRSTQMWFRRERQHFTEALQAWPACLRPIPSQAIFSLLRLESVTAGWLARRLHERGIAVRDASNFVGLNDRYLRVALRSSEDNRRLLDELSAILGNGPRTTDNGP